MLLLVRFVDADASGAVNAGDRLELTFDSPVVLLAPDPSQDLTFVPGDTPGAGASLRAGVSAQVVELVLGSGPVLSITGTYRPGIPAGAGDTPAQVGLSGSAATNIVSPQGGAGVRLGDPPLSVQLKDPVGYPLYQGRAYTAPAPADANPYLGNLHAHTGFSNDSTSPGDADPNVAWAYARDVAQIGFMAVSDHLNHFDAAQWSQTLAFAAGEQRANFVALTGFEWGHGKNAAGDTYNHINILGTTVALDLAATLTLDGLYQQALSLCYPQGGVGHWNHPSFGPNAGLDNWDGFPYDGQVDKLMALIRCEGAGGQDTAALGYVPALDQGWHVAPTSNQDNHRGEWGDKTSRRTGAWLDTFTPAELSRALREGRVYSSSDANAAVRLLANGSLWMGSTVSGAGPVTLRAEWSDPDAGDTFTSLHLVSNGGIRLQTLSITGSSGFVEVTVDPAADSYFYVELRQADGASLISAPIYVDR